MKHLKMTLPAAIALALGAQSALALEFNGYMRAGTGVNSDGGDQVCFQAPGARAKYRLGNECEIFGEYAFSEQVFTGEDGANFKIHGMFAFVVEGEQDFEETSPAFRQWWAEASNVAGGIFEGASFWAGKRYYYRNDVHINDFYYWGQGGRTGGGVEDINLGFGKLAAAYFQNSNDDFTRFSFDVLDPATGLPTGEVQTLQGNRIQVSDRSVSSIDVRLYDLDVNPGGKLTLGLDTRISTEDQDDFKGRDGFMINVLHHQKGIFGKEGYNKLALQYGQGAASTLADDSNDTAGNDVKTYRLVEQLVFQPTDSWSGMWVLVYEKRDNDPTFDPIDWWFSTGIRPKYYFTDYFDVSVELGYDRVSPERGDDRELVKFTIAPEISAGRGFFARPALRVFATYANWNDAAADAGVVLSSNGNTFEDQTDGWTYGVQAEAWW